MKESSEKSHVLWKGSFLAGFSAFSGGSDMMVEVVETWR